jgi:hypothetical protein
MPAPLDTFAMGTYGPLNDSGEDTSRLVGEKMVARVKIHRSNVGSACGTTSRRSAILLITFAADA